MSTLATKRTVQVGSPTVSWVRDELDATVCTSDEKGIEVLFSA